MLYRVERRLDIQGLRAFAVILVIAFHEKRLFLSGYMGVDIFFVISGFVITMSFLNLPSDARKISSFLIKRILRLAPPLLVVTLATTIIGIFIIPISSIRFLFHTAISSIFYFSNFVIFQNSNNYFGQEANSNPLLHTWSLSVEMQFYFIFIIFYMAYRRLKSFYILLFSFLFFIVFIKSFEIWYHNFSNLSFISDFFGSYFSPISRIWEFQVGIISALARRNFRIIRIITKIRYISFFLFSFLIWTLYVLLEFSNVFENTLIIFGIGMVLLFSNSQMIFFKTMSSRLLVHIGDRSYSLYLWHFPVIVLVRFLVKDSLTSIFFTLILTYILSLISYHYIERNFSFIDKLDVNWNLKIVYQFFFILSLFLLPVTLYIGIVSKANIFDVSQHIDHKFNCQFESIKGMRQSDFTNCVFNRYAPKEPIWLIGDSNAGQFSEALLSLAISQNRPLIILTGSLVQIVDVSRMRSAVDKNWRNFSLEYRRKVLEFLKDNPGGTVIVSTSPQVWSWNDWEVSDNEKWTKDNLIKAKYYERKLEESINLIKSLGFEVILIQHIPQIPGQDWDRLRVQSNYLSVKNRGDLFFNINDMLDVSDAKKALIMAGKNTNTKVVDITSQLCEISLCKIKFRNNPYFLDRTHISVWFSNKLNTYFQKQI